MNDAISFESGERTRAFREFSHFLIGQVVKCGETISHKSYYTPPDASALYMMTRYMTDEELNYINHRRQQAGYRNRDGSPIAPLPRLAYQGEDNFIIVTNQRERKVLENKRFGDQERVVRVPEPHITHLNKGRRY